MLLCSLFHAEFRIYLMNRIIESLQSNGNEFLPDGSWCTGMVVSAILNADVYLSPLKHRSCLPSCFPGASEKQRPQVERNAFQPGHRRFFSEKVDVELAARFLMQDRDLTCLPLIQTAYEEGPIMTSWFAQHQRAVCLNLIHAFGGLILTFAVSLFYTKFRFGSIRRC